MKIFVGMETSGQLRRRFAARGHDVTSCDILPADDRLPSFDLGNAMEIEPGVRHIQGDVFDTLEQLWALDWWPDLAIFHPTCTYLTVAAEWAYKDPDFDRYPGVGYHQRLQPGTLFGADRRAARLAAVEDWKRIDALPIARKVAENPAKGALSKMFRRPDQCIHPYMLGDDASKETGLWLWGVDPMDLPLESDWVEPTLRANGKRYWANQTDNGQNRLSPGADRWQKRSETFPGIADALVDHLT